jgi:hypothetical protein
MFRYGGLIPDNPGAVGASDAIFSSIPNPYMIHELYVNAPYT